MSRQRKTSSYGGQNRLKRLAYQESIRVALSTSTQRTPDSDDDEEVVDPEPPLGFHEEPFPGPSRPKIRRVAYEYEEETDAEEFDV